MRIKNLVKISITNNTATIGNGLAAVLYNLAFSPLLLYLNISNNNINDNQAKDLNVSIYKLLNINSSIEVIKC